MLIGAAFLLIRAIPQYAFWLLLSGEFRSFLISPRDTSSGYIGDHLDKILYIFYIYSGFYNYPLYKIVIVFDCSLWFDLLILEVSSDDLLWNRVFSKNINNIFY